MLLAVVAGVCDGMCCWLWLQELDRLADELAAFYSEALSTMIDDV